MTVIGARLAAVAAYATAAFAMGTDALAWLARRFGEGPRAEVVLLRVPVVVHQGDGRCGGQRADERDLIRRAMKKAKRNKTLAAKLLHLHRTALLRRIAALGMKDDE